MGGDRDGDMTGQDPLSSTAEGDEDPGTAALGEAGTGAGPGSSGETEEGRADERSGTPTPGPPPEALDDTPVTDAVPEQDLGFPDG